MVIVFHSKLLVFKWNLEDHPTSKMRKPLVLQVVLRWWWFLHWARGLESWVRSQSPQLMEDFEWKNLLETYQNEWFRGSPRLGNLYLLTWHIAIFFQVIRRLRRYRDDLCMYFSMPIHQRFEEGPEVDFCDGLLMFTCLKVRWWSLVGGDWNHGIFWFSIQLGIS